MNGVSKDTYRPEVEARELHKLALRLQWNLEIRDKAAIRHYVDDLLSRLGLYIEAGWAKPYVVSGKKGMRPNVWAAEKCRACLQAIASQVRAGELKPDDAEQFWQLWQRFTMLHTEARYAAQKKNKGREASAENQTESKHDRASEDIRACALVYMKFEHKHGWRPSLDALFDAMRQHERTSGISKTRLKRELTLKKISAKAQQLAQDLEQIDAHSIASMLLN